VQFDLTFLVTGIIFGLSGGLTPGPLLTLVISETLRHNIREGIKISFAPIFSDLPIVLVTLFLISELSDTKPVLGTIALLGSIYLIYLAYENISFKGADVTFNGEKPQSLRKGVIANFVNPNPYIFWMTIGAPTVLKASENGFAPPLLFIVGMYVSMIGAKISIATLVGKSRKFLSSSIYKNLIRALGLVLLIFALYFIHEALIAFGII
jgi:threonine/homoserine/homoserine lactone efflux protein